MVIPNRRARCWSSQQPAACRMPWRSLAAATSTLLDLVAPNRPAACTMPWQRARCWMPWRCRSNEHDDRCRCDRGILFPMIGESMTMNAATRCDRCLWPPARRQARWPINHPSMPMNADLVAPGGSSWRSPGGFRLLPQISSQAKRHLDRLPDSPSPSLRSAVRCRNRCWWLLVAAGGDDQRIGSSTPPIRLNFL